MRSRLLLTVPLAAALWIATLHFWFAPPAPEARRAEVALPLMERQLALFEDPAEREATLGRMRRANAEWDFMGRTFLVLALANEALREPAARARQLAVIDRVLDETLALEAEHGPGYFLLPYASRSAFVQSPPRSMFVDGEIALMLAARQRVERADRYVQPLAERIALMAARMEQAPVLSLESYPDECWTFCNAVALAAIRLHGDPAHGELLSRWVATARERLVHPQSGLLVSSYHFDGTHGDGPEGSSIFLVAHMLSIVDPAFARDQYERARRELGRSFAGFGWAREWPASWHGPTDIDSGPIVPFVEASAGASGMAILGAAAFDDDAWLAELLTSLELAAFPIREARGETATLRYAASNQVGDATMLYALTEGPLFATVTP